MPKFVVLSHTFPENHSDDDHFDLMIEDGGRLATWRLNEWPHGDAVQSIIHLPPHRVAYLEYEGPVSNDRGHVNRIEAGVCQIEARSSERWIVTLQSDSFTGKISLDKSEEHSNESDRIWSMQWLD